MKKNSEIAIVGRACRLPGANSVSRLWQLLRDNKCAVTHIPSDRWSLDRFGHPRHGERGRSYTWAAGVLDDIWGFDPAAFGLSPREAEQMDPQQRLLLELTWEALEDAGIKPSSIAGTETGVFVGASTTDHGNSKMFDIASTDGYFATGNAASILANRVSYIYDLNGPSFTVDTACSSSIVALDAAVQALRSGRIETAIVGGVSILTTPFQFVNFSQASMLSRVGLCQAFSANADGYVRSEGGAVLVLRAPGSVAEGTDRIHGTVIETRVNSDGRTNGIALPSKKRQSQLLEQLYGGASIDPNHLAFVEAHGTGTPVGDPIEATALGETLGRGRIAPLPIGSIKSNIGHTEAAAGLAGVLKAMLALENDLLPASLHCDEPNPNIDFDRLNLRVASTAIALERGSTPRLAGVSSYGFGGTNAHVVLGDAPPVTNREPATAPNVLMLSAHTRAALADLAETYAQRIDAAAQRSDAVRPDAATLMAAANHRRDTLIERLVLPVDRDTDVATALRAVAQANGENTPPAIVGTAVGREAPVAFVYSGNGSQWVGMGRTAYRDSNAFRTRFDEVDTLFRPRAGWSLATMLMNDALDEHLGKTSVAQPLIFAIQSATTFALKQLGLVPDFVFGHSVGEVAAAEAAEILDLATAVKVIYFRSLHQELAFEAGGMTVVIGSREAAETLLETIPGLSIAAYNSPRAYTFSGSLAALDQLAVSARGLKARAQKLDIAYPFHSALIAPIEQPLLADLGTLPSATGTATFVSTVTGTALPGTDLDALYWWHNVREPVLFSQAIEEATRLGARLFVEIGPSPILLSHINDTLAAGDITIATLPVLDRKEQSADAFRTAAAVALSRGAVLRQGSVLGIDPGPLSALPSYPWQKKSYRLGDTTEAIGFLTARPWHPLVGARYALDQLEWHSQIDTALVPALADHVVEGHVLLPGAAFAEMALAVARDWLGTETAAIADFEIHQPMILAGTASRGVRCRVQPVTGTIEIMSRPRLGQAAWQTHAVAKILRFTGAPVDVPDWSEPEGRATMSGKDLYPAAAISGLQYGPAFQLLESVYRVGPDAIVVDLVSGEGDQRFGIDPARVDACFHGLVLLFADLAVAGRLKPYVPVGISEVKLFQPHVPVARAYIEVVRSDERTIVVHFTLVDAHNRPVALLHKARFQAMNAFRSSERPIDYIGQKAILAAEPLAVQEEPAITPAQVVSAAKAAGRLSGDDATAPYDYVLLDGWATAVAFGLFEALSQNGIIDIEALVAAGTIEPRLTEWFTRLLGALERSGLVVNGDAGYMVVANSELPDPRDILRALAADHPNRSAELLLAARTGALIDTIAKGSFGGSAPATLTAIDGFEFGGHAALGSATLLADILARLDGAWPKDRAMRVLQIGDGPLSAHAVRLAEAHSAELTIVEPDRRRLERARLSFDKHDRLAFVAGVDQLAPASFDVVIAAQSLYRIAADRTAWLGVSDAMAPNAVLIAVEAEASVFRDLVFGLHAVLTASADTVEIRYPGVASEAGWTRALAEIDLTEVSVLPTNDTDYALLCVGRKSAARAARVFKGDALVIGDSGPMSGTASALATMLMFSGLKVSSLADTSGAAETPLEIPETLVYLAQPAGDLTSAERLAERCLDLKRLVSLTGAKKTSLWIVCPGATRCGQGADAVEAGVWAFSRTLANEVHALDIRRIDLVPGLTADVAARRLRDVILSGTAETDIVLDESGTHVLRFTKVDPQLGGAIDPDVSVLRLVKGENSSLDRLRWAPELRREPDAGEVEIAVEAAGLNFRDVMWGLSILPEEILEDGYAGATLGLEGAGRIVRVGAGVTRFKVGDKVLAFAKAALATHVTVTESVVAPMPDGLSMAAAATVPVAFLTAYYGLVRCARLDEDEWVLIHGGAGGVGLAAMQIARWRGARIIATAGSPERRDLLTALGAEHVFDSRSNQFVDDIRRVTDGGVGVVLNSLSGEAMERSIAVLRPFGRFVELGKRDYVANTHIGLKPFRRNLSYFGVDLDQLILKGDAPGQSLFDDVMALFDEGSLSPLPYRIFSSDDVVDAFRVMQRSGHVGKIVIVPPALPTERTQSAQSFMVSPDRTHLITGGLGGFGIATAQWLVDRGARHLILIGRSGAASEDAKQAVDAMTEAGVSVHIASLDITNEAAVLDLLAETARTMPPLAGVIHAATVFDDAIVANLDRTKLDNVLSAKMIGAEILDRATRTSTLDYFLLYSSATTMIGNPGQSAYVAANAFLEALARRRQKEGLPGFAVAWGAIEDVGILARSGSSTTNLLARSGVLGMKARDALDHLADILPIAATLPDPAVLAVASVNWSTAREHLPVLRSSSFAELMHGVQVSEAGDVAKIDVKALVEKLGPAAASKAIVETISEEIARILRLPRDDVSRSKPLMEIGLDSLMAVELGMGLEERFALDAPLSTSAGAMTVLELADYIVGMSGSGDGKDQASEALALRHLDADIRKEMVDALPGLVDSADRKEIVQH
ncbi:SDR family NAD(P)-dependent oxidoreductase [Lichenihabitans sp. PAMC28606]|uniref:type I polyketide synthase n=1 Tax=Lichenihabitans sp. PAMC28606 TaxID=2880932 RepID=UPI001D0A07CE|nr:type I polyketide synthase [Lichenihabitans sp. PAMC28606]UDL93940.1 SDR family NAD(P)-dependent oxidoreductase [Lichenihabitans sp. PAMC28606]